jgi:hypothetical protein
MLPSRPLAGVAPEAAVEPGGPVFFVDDELLYAESPKGFVTLMAIGRTRSICSC